MKNILKTNLVQIDLDQISDHELATKHTAALRATFEPEWNILNDFSSHLSSLQQVNREIRMQKNSSRY